MNCRAEVKYFHPASSWECYILAMNPQDEDEIKCIINGFTVELCTWSLKELLDTYHYDGEYVIQDQEFTPILALTLFKRLEG